MANISLASALEIRIELEYWSNALLFGRSIGNFSGDAVATLALMVRVVAMVAATDAIFCACLWMDCCCCWLETENAAAEPTVDRAKIVEIFMVM